MPIVADLTSGSRRRQTANQHTTRPHLSAEQIAESLDKCRRSGSGWVACCPAHDDKNPSLSITEVNDGIVLVHCFAGCSQEAVIAALRDRGLWHEPGPYESQRTETIKQKAERQHNESVLMVAENDLENDVPISQQDRDDLQRSIDEIKKVPDEHALSIAELAALPPIEYDRQREEAATRLGIRVTTLDAEVIKARKGAGKTDTESSTGLISEPEPWPEPVDGKYLLDELAKFFTDYMVLPDGAASALTLWTLHTYTHQIARISPLLVVTSPEKRCGKTTLLSLFELVTHRALSTSNITSAALFRTVEHYQPTLIIDEADSFVKTSEDLRGIINSGHNRSTAYVIRTVGEDYEPKKFSTWAPKAIATIGNLPETIMDRAIVIKLRRKKSDEQVKRLRTDKLTSNNDLARQCLRWAHDNMEAIRAVDPGTPETLHDRAQDNWRSLLAIAETVGGKWPDRATQAALILTDSEDADAPGVMLLADIKEIFEKRTNKKIRSVELVDHLVEMDHRPWPEWKKGKPITARQVARILKPFGINSKPIRDGGAPWKGYEESLFTDAFARYLQPTPDVTVTRLQHHKNRHSGDISSVTPSDRVTDEKALKPLDLRRCNRVTDENREGVQYVTCRVCSNWRDRTCVAGLVVSDPGTERLCGHWSSLT